MKFFKKRWVAVILCIVMVAVSFVLADSRRIRSAEDWGRRYADNYRWLVVDAGELLSERTEEELAAVIGALDYRHGAVMALQTVEHVPGTMEEAARECAWYMELSEADALLLVEAEHRSWYLYTGSTFVQYADGQLTQLMEASLADEVRKPDRQLTELYSELLQWYADHIPNTEDSGRTAAPGSLFGSILVACLLAVLVLLALLAALVRAVKRHIRTKKTP